MTIQSIFGASHPSVWAGNSYLLSTKRVKVLAEEKLTGHVVGEQGPPFQDISRPGQCISLDLGDSDTDPRFDWLFPCQDCCLGEALGEESSADAMLLVVEHGEHARIVCDGGSQFGVPDPFREAVLRIVDDAGGGEVGNGDLVWTDADHRACQSQFNMKAFVQSLRAVLLMESMDVFRPPTCYDIPLQHEVAVTCDKGTRHVAKAGLVRRLDSLIGIRNCSIHAVSKQGLPVLCYTTHMPLRPHRPEPTQSMPLYM